MHICDVDIKVDYFEEDDPVNLNTPVTLHNLHNSIRTQNNNNNNNESCKYTRKRHLTQSSLFDYLPETFRARYGNESDEITNTLWGQSYTTKFQNTIRVWYSNPRGLGENPQ